MFEERVSSGDEGSEASAGGTERVLTSRGRTYSAAPAEPNPAANAGSRDDPTVGSGALSLGAVTVGLAGLAQLDVTGVADGELVAAARLVERAQRGLDALRLHVAGELHTRATTDIQHGLRTPTWLAHTTGLPPAVARRTVTLATRLRRLPNIDAALSSALIGIDHTRVLVDAANPRIADAIDAAVPALISDITTTRFETWRNEVHAFARDLDQDGPEPATRPASLSLRRVGDELIIKGHIDGLTGEALRQTIETHADRLYRQAIRDRDETDSATDIPARSELLAHALHDLVRHGHAATHTGTAPAPDVTLTIHTNPTNPTGPVTAHLPDGSTLPLQPNDVTLCAPLITPITLNTHGVPLDLGRTTRYATRDQRRALATRDGGCVFPGCDAPAPWCDAHHVTPWDHHGTTDLHNLALLCRHHHGVTHRTGWTMTTTPNQWFTWTTPHGHTATSQRHGHQHPGPAPPTVT